MPKTSLFRTLRPSDGAASSLDAFLSAVGQITPADAPTLSFADLLLLVDQVYRIGGVLQDGSFVPVTTAKVPLSGWQVDSNAPLHDGVTEVREIVRAAARWHLAATTSPRDDELLGSHDLYVAPAVAEYLRHPATPVREKFHLLDQLLELAGDHIRLGVLRDAALRGGGSRDPITVAVMAAICGGALGMLAGCPLVLMILDARVTSALRDIVATLKREYERSLSRVLEEQLRAQGVGLRRMIIIDPDTMLAVSSIEVSLAAIDAFEKHPKPHKPLIDYADHHAALLVEHRPSPPDFATSFELTELASCVTPSGDSQAWPRSVPECEEVARRFLVEMLQSPGRIPDTKGLSVICSTTGDALVLRHPSAAAIGGGRLAPRIRRALMVDPMATWLAFPSTHPVKDSAFFVGSAYGKVASRFVALYEDAQLVHRYQRVNAAILDVAATGVGGAISPGILADLIPGISPAVAAGAGAMAGHLVSKWIDWVTRR